MSSVSRVRDSVVVVSMILVGFRGLALPQQAQPLRLRLLLDCDRLARTQPHREFQFLTESVGWVLDQHVRFVVVADLENLRRYFRTLCIAFAGMTIHYDFH